MGDQLRLDLESLLGEVDVGWSNAGPWSRATVTTGVGGCLLQEMIRVTRYDAWDSLAFAAQERIDDMIVALGFNYQGSRRLEPHDSAMYEWNDAQTDPNEIKLRIKDALNRLNVC